MATNRLQPTPERRGGARRLTQRDSEVRVAPQVVYGIGVLLLLGLVVLASSPLGMMLALGFAVLAVALVVLGPERMGWLSLGLAFFSAPMDRGPLGASTPVILADLFFLMALVLLLPRLLLGSSRLATPLVLGPLVIFFTGMLASITSSENPLVSLRTLTVLTFCMLFIPFVIAVLEPGRAAIRRLAWCFIAGQAISTVYSLAQDPTTAIRHQGLSHHPNSFAEAGLLAFALLLYLIPTAARRRPAYAMLALMLLSVYVSGSRGAIIGVALLLMAVPFIERSTPAGGVMLGVGVVGLVALALVADKVSSESALGRILGGDTSSASDDVRSDALSEGVRRFFEHPLIGTGLDDLGVVHNLPLEIAVGCGVFGLVGYLAMIWALARPIFSSSEHRRIAHTTLAFSLFVLTAPALVDRMGWMVIGLGAAIFRGFRDPIRPLDGDPEPEPEPQQEPAGPPGRHAAPSNTIRSMPGVIR